MKRFFQLSLLFALSINLNAQVSISKWQEQPIVIDGNAADWVTNPRFFNAETNVQYEFRNDSQNLYIILKTTDRATQIQFLRAGFVIHLKVKTKPPTKFSITFPPMKMENMEATMNNLNGKPDQLVEKTALKADMQFKDSVFLEGFKFSKGAITAENKDSNSIFFAKSDKTSEQTFYELRIPIREIYGNEYVIENIRTIPLQLQVTINNLSQSQNPKTQARKGERVPGGRPRGGGQRGMDGGMSGGREMEGETGDRPSMQEGRSAGGSSAPKKSFSIDFQLSTRK